jgi:hypothetical protein
MRIFFIFITLICVCIQESNAQVRPQQRHIFFLGLGPSGFMGDLGGANQIGTQGIRDFDFQTIRPTIQAGYRYFLTHEFAVSGRLSFGHLTGNDKHTQEPFRNNRNLSFRSQLLEFSANGEWFFFSYGRAGARFSNHVLNTGRTGATLRTYIFGGIGGFYFNPQGYFRREHYLTLQHASVSNPDLLPENGWFNLRNIGTEGQGLPGYPDNPQYSSFKVTFPVGLGMVIRINRNWNIGMEYGFRTTLTDYIDDVSTSYMDPSIFRSIFPDDPARAALGEFFSNPTNYGQGSAPTMPGLQRGNPENNDSYMFLIFSLQFTPFVQPGSPWWAPFIQR